MTVPRIVYVHDGKAFYPTMLAGEKILSSLGYRVEKKSRDEIGESEDYSDAILWLMMGFYPKRPAKSCIAVIHEYRSQSVGRWAAAKDIAKVFLNHRPSYRLFQSEKIKLAFNRRDGVPCGLLPLGVPSNIVNHRARLGSKTQYDFCYIGAISNDRCIAQMLDAFLEAYGGGKSFVLVGDVRDGLDQLYAKHKNLFFVGRVSQETAFSLVNASEFSVCFFPTHPPHCYQPPTKLYEYAALGRKIIANRSPATLEEIGRLNIQA